MEFFTSYIKNIVFFLIFSSFIGIILPSGKYKNYISVVLGFMLLFIVVEPVIALDKAGLNKLVLQMSQQIESGTSVKLKDIQEASGIDDYEKMQKEMLAKNFDIQLQSQIAVKVAPLGYRVQKLQSSGDFEAGVIDRLDIWLEKGSEVPKGDITIEKITIKSIEAATPQTQNKADNIETAESAEIKKLLADFYNISIDNIHINIVQ